MTLNNEAENATPAQAAKSDNSGVKLMITAVMAVFCIAICSVLLINVFMSAGSSHPSAQTGVSNSSVMDQFDMYVTNQISNVLDGIVAVKKEYKLSDSDLVAPEPAEENFGQVKNPEELAWLLDEAAYLLDRQETLFSVDTPIWPGEKISYYYDETILVITWKQEFDNSIYTISEVKIADASQFRRFLAGGEFGSDKQYTTTEMAESVNAVVASSGDFYKYRRCGIMVNNGVVQRMEDKEVDTCFIDENGDLIFSYRGELTDMESAQQFVDENSIRFSVAFGPVLVDDGEMVAPSSYPLGEINEPYSRAAVCQMDELHYLLVTLNGENEHPDRQRIRIFAQRLQELGVDKAYALDGGQTAAIAMQGETINRVDFGTQRNISDIIYFATALPEED